MKGLFALRRQAIAPLDYNRRLWMRLWLLAIALFLYAPLLVLVVFSFNASKSTILWAGFSTRHYQQLIDNKDLMTALGNSLTIAFLATIVAVVLGALAAVMLWRFRFPGKAAVEGTMALPIVVPEICMGVAMLIFFAWIRWPMNLPWPFSLSAIVIAHATFCFPFVAMVVRARLASFNLQEEEAAQDLGANEWQSFRDVLLPHMKPALIAGALLSFTMSLDDFVITFFTSGPTTVTFPVKIYSMLRFSVTPQVNAISTVLLVITVALTAIALRLQDRSGGTQSMGGH